MIAEVLNPKINFACYCVGYQSYYILLLEYNIPLSLQPRGIFTSVHYLFITVVMVMDNRQYKGSA